MCWNKSVQSRPDAEKIKAKLDEDYNRLVHPDKMGEIYKILYFGSERLGEVFPFLEKELNKEKEFY